MRYVFFFSCYKWGNTFSRPQWLYLCHTIITEYEASHEMTLDRYDVIWDQNFIPKCLVPTIMGIENWQKKLVWNVETGPSIPNAHLGERTSSHRGWWISKKESLYPFESYRLHSRCRCRIRNGSTESSSKYPSFWSMISRAGACKKCLKHTVSF